MLPAAFVSLDPGLSRVLDPLWATPALAAVPRHGGSFWMCVRPQAA